MHGTKSDVGLYLMDNTFGGPLCTVCHQVKVFFSLITVCLSSTLSHQHYITVDNIGQSIPVGFSLQFGFSHFQSVTFSVSGQVTKHHSSTLVCYYAPNTVVYFSALRYFVQINKTTRDLDNLKPYVWS